MMYKIIYKCQNCDTRFYEDAHRDTIVSAIGNHYCDTDNLLRNLFDNPNFMITLFQRGGGSHKCEMNTIGHGKVIGLTKISKGKYNPSVAQW